MAGMNVSASTSMTGALQKYFTSAWMNLKKTDYETPLANSSHARTAVIPRNSGQTMEARFIDRFEPTVVSATDSTPKLITETAENTAKTMTATVVNIPLGEIQDHISLNPILLDTDPADLLVDVKEQLMVLVSRYVHRISNSAFVNECQDPNTWKIGTLPTPFKTINAGEGVNNDVFADLTESSYHNWDSFLRARSILRNTRIPTFSGSYKCVISDGIKEQLIESDSRFGDWIKRHQDVATSVLQMGVLPTYRGIDFIIQDDEYRAQLPNSGGTLAARNDSGRVQVATMFGKDAWTYLDLAGKRKLNPKFKVQDISISGNELTVSFRIPFNASVLQTRRGLNIAGTTNFYSDIDDLV